MLDSSSRIPGGGVTTGNLLTHLISIDDVLLINNIGIGMCDQFIHQGSLLRGWWTFEMPFVTCTFASYTRWGSPSSRCHVLRITTQVVA